MYKIAFVYPKELPSGGDQLKYLKSSGRDKTCYYLYISQGFNLLDNIDYQKIRFAGSSFDISSIDKEFDAIILWDLFEYGITYKNIKNSKAVICGSCPDVYTLNEWMVYRYQEYNIDFFYHIFSKLSYQNVMRDVLKLDPDMCEYRCMPRGISENFLTRNDPIGQRAGPVGYRSRKVLISGATDHFTYDLRREIKDSNHPSIISVEELESRIPGVQFIGDDYYSLLHSTSAHISACEVITGKSFESLGCGCLTFIEAGPNVGPDEIGLIDNQNCIFITKENWQRKIQSYVETYSDIRWAEIAKAGRELALERFSTKSCAENIVKACMEISREKNA